MRKPETAFDDKRTSALDLFGLQDGPCAGGFASCSTAPGSQDAAPRSGQGSLEKLLLGQGESVVCDHCNG